MMTTSKSTGASTISSSIASKCCRRIRPIALSWSSCWKCLIILFSIHIGGEKTYTPVHDLKSFDMDSAEVGKAVFGKEIYAVLRIKPRTYSDPGSSHT